VKKYFEMLCLLLLIFLVCSCASQSVSPPSEWPYEKGAIHLRLKADTQLNLYDGDPHTLLLCVYQLRDRNAFDQLTEDDDGLRKLLECSRFDASVAGCKRLFVQPGEEMIYSLDRPEGAKYVAIVAGYYLLQKEGMVRLYDVPWFVEEKGFIRRTMVAKPGPLDIDLVLGLDQIQKSGETLGI
jgi:type VI secretion system VasD/TssJ family lipoprotein